jgi:hypothetical protein
MTGVQTDAAFIINVNSDGTKGYYSAFYCARRRSGPDRGPEGQEPRPGRTELEGPVEAVIAVGGGRLAMIRFGLLPQVLSVFASEYFFESNTRPATIIDIVGAGGFGLYLSEMIRVLEWREAAFLIPMLLIAVAAIDAISCGPRAAIIGAPRN